MECYSRGLCRVYDLPGDSDVQIIYLNLRTDHDDAERTGPYPGTNTQLADRFDGPVRVCQFRGDSIPTTGCNLNAQSLYFISLAHPTLLFWR